MDKLIIGNNTQDAFIDYLSQRKEEYNIEEICTYDKTPKFIAHDSLELWIIS